MKAMKGKVIAEVVSTKENVRDSGIVIPEGEANDQLHGDLRKAVVISSGVDEVHVGDLILYHRIAGTPLENGLIVLEEKYIYGVVE